MDEAMNPYAPRTMGARDPLKDISLLRDLDIINARTRLELGVLPHGGLPVQQKRKPLQNLRHVDPATEIASDD